MKAKRLCVLLTIAAAASVSLVGCGYDQKTGGVDEIADITDVDYLKLSMQPIWNGKVREVLTTEVDAEAGYKLQGTNAVGQPITFADIDGVTGISYKYYKKSSKVSISDISTPSNNQYWDDDAIHLKDNIGTPLETDSIKEKGSYFVVMSFKVNENRYKRIPDLVCELHIVDPAVITNDNFSFTEKKVEWTGEDVTNYATVTLNGEIITLSPVLSEEMLTKLGLKTITYKYNTGDNNTWSTTKPNKAGQYQTQISLEPLDNVQTPDLETTSANIIIQKNVVSYTISYDVNNILADEIADKTTTNAVLTNDELAVTPTAEGYTFGGWFIDKACTQEANTLTSTTTGLTLYAKWTPTNASTGFTFDETFDIKNAESYDQITVSNANVVNTDGSLKISTISNADTGSLKYALKNLEYKDTNINAKISFDLTESKNTTKWGSFALYYTNSENKDTWIVDNQSDETANFGIRTDKSAQPTHIDQTKVAGTKYTYTIDVTLSNVGLTYSIKVSDGANTYTLVTDKSVEGVTNISSIYFGNATAIDRSVTIDNLKVTVMA